MHNRAQPPQLSPPTDPTHPTSKALSPSFPLACRGNVLELLEDIQELRPTIFSSVPRLWNRIYDKVMAQVMG